MLPHPTNHAGHLVVGGADAVDIAHTYGTPVMVYDVADIRTRARAFREAFAEQGVDFQVAYASKALSILAIYQVAVAEGLYIDVVSGGELFTALRAGVPADRVHFHGNNNGESELRYALASGIGCVVVDSMREVELLPRLALEVWAAADAEAGAAAATTGANTAGSEPAAAQARALPASRVLRVLLRVLLRVAPGVTAHTHEHNTTGQVDSKFGLDIASGQAAQAFKQLSAQPHVRVLGLHCHIGSQIFSTAGHGAATTRLMHLMDDWGMQSCVLNVGGGFGVRYTAADTPLPLREYVSVFVGAAKEFVAARQRRGPGGVQVPTFWIEPGRSLVSEAGTTLYTVGAQKVVPDVRTYIAVDGGMSDNMRPVTYQAIYSAALANRMCEPADNTYTVVGKLCESGDQLIHDAKLPAVQEGDVLAVFCTGAYCYSMASNYNKMCRPAIVFVEDGQPRLVVRRETPEDLIQNELPYS